MRVLFFANRMPDMCGAFLHDIDLAIEFQKRGHSVSFLTIERPKEGYDGGFYRGFKFAHYSAAGNLLDTSHIWVCPHAPCLPYVRKVNSRGYHRPIVATCHFDGRYNSITANASDNWSEMLLFINSRMELSYRKNIPQFPRSIVRTGVVRPIMHENKIAMDSPPDGDAITLVNANVNKGVHQFIEMAKRMPTRKFLGVVPYYGELWVPPAPSNVEWIPFDDDVRKILKRTRILLMPSLYESFGRIAVEAMYNGIPVLYSKPQPNSTNVGGTTEGMEEWIVPAGISCERDKPEEWMAAIDALDDVDVYVAKQIQVKQHVRDMNLFTEASRISDMIEVFQREHPVTIMSASTVSQPASKPEPGQPPVLRPPPATARIGFSSGRLRLQRYVYP
jgi:glycosyltransferase involved in cell wall biosynthesis